MLRLKTTIDDGAAKTRLPMPRIDSHQRSRFRRGLIHPAAIRSAILVAAWLFGETESGRAEETLEQRTMTAITILDGAEDRFERPDPNWYETTRQALEKETRLVGAALDSHGEAYAAAWKNHLHWPLLTSNLGSIEQSDFEQLALVRRWLYSNRQGLEYPFFAEIRQRTDDHLDALFTCSQRDLEESFRRQVDEARQQLAELAADPSDDRAAALGRTIGWLERTQQLPQETASLRSLLSLPNAQIVVAKPLLDRIIALLAKEVEQSLPVSDRVPVPKGGLLSRSRTATVRGIANTSGQIGLELEASAAFADLKLVYTGQIKSQCRAVIGPVTVAMLTSGPVRAITPIQVSLQGVELLATEVFPKVRTRITGVTAQSPMVRRLGERRANAPEAYQQMNSRARSKASSLLRQEMDERIEQALEKIQSEIRQTKAKLDNFQEVLAPVVREGAAPHWQGLESSPEGVIVNIIGGNRQQLGAVLPCPSDSSTADVQVRLHVSLFNNMAETIMAGKVFTDTYFMNYGRILQPTLPPPLMVHSRSQRWSVVAANPRPLEIAITDRNQFRIQLRMQRVEIEGERFTGSTVATIKYALVKDRFGEYRLERQGEVQLDSPLPQESQTFLLHKFNAFFAPILSGGGVALPEGGTLGRFRLLRSQGVYADESWLVLGVGVPAEFLEPWLSVFESTDE